MTDYKKLCVDLFGTDNIEELYKIAKKNNVGRKKALSENDIKKAALMQQEGKTTSEIAAHFGVSRQTVSKYLNKRPNKDFSLRMDFMHKQRVCTEIYVDLKNKKVKAVNRTGNPLYRAFGINENPDWQDFNDFLEERCFPRTRANRKDILNSLGLTGGYEPLDIISLNGGRSADDNQYINIKYYN